MNTEIAPADTAPADKPKRRKTVPPTNTVRAALDPTEFGLAFGKSKSWTYRMIYTGKIRTITGLGATLIPVSEVERLTSEATEEYQPQTQRGRKPAIA
jgi:hypothetical protein